MPCDDIVLSFALVDPAVSGLRGVLVDRWDDLQGYRQAWDELAVGGLMINEVPAFRVDHMPYGGTKDSGSGREGLRFAMDEMTEPRVLVLSHLPL